MRVAWSLSWLMWRTPTVLRCLTTTLLMFHSKAASSLVRWFRDRRCWTARRTPRRRGTPRGGWKSRWWTRPGYCVLVVLKDELLSRPPLRRPKLRALGAGTSQACWRYYGPGHRGASGARWRGRYRPRPPSWRNKAMFFVSLFFSARTKLVDTRSSMILNSNW